MRSMTGFGRGTASGEGFSVSVELKTVNNRFLDVSLRVSGEMQSLEAAVRRAIGSRLSRGRVEVNLQYERSDEVTYELNRPLIAGYITALREMSAEFGLKGEPDLNMIVRLPNVMQARRDEMPDGFADAVASALERALDALERMRTDEGEMLKRELDSRLREIQINLRPIVDNAESIPNEYRERLTRRISDMLSKGGGDIEIDPGRLAQEVAYLSDRADISEEIARLETHIDHFRSIMADEKEVGKQLDFLTQELNREANTITSKTNNMTIKENALAIKSSIEKIREQIQNVE